MHSHYITLSVTINKISTFYFDELYFIFDKSIDKYNVIWINALLFQ